jgi:hypothetical protein
MGGDDFGQDEALEMVRFNGWTMPLGHHRSASSRMTITSRTLSIPLVPFDPPQLLEEVRIDNHAGFLFKLSAVQSQNQHLLVIKTQCAIDVV